MIDTVWFLQNIFFYSFKFLFYQKKVAIILFLISHELSPFVSSLNLFRGRKKQRFANLDTNACAQQTDKSHERRKKNAAILNEKKLRKLFHINFSLQRAVCLRVCTNWIITIFRTISIVLNLRFHLEEKFKWRNLMTHWSETRCVWCHACVFS